jgi:prepilin-type N-terminal cleavage/methylation domain-containing protein
MRPRAAFSLVELVVALTIFSIGVLGLVGAATVAHGSFGSAEAVERGGRAASLVLDSLFAVPAPESGSAVVAGTPLRWQVRDDSAAVHVELQLDVQWKGRTRTVALSAARLSRRP